MNKYMIQAQQIISEWNAKTGAEQQAFCRNCVLKAIRGGRKLAHGDELGDATNNTYIDVRKRLADVDKLARSIENRASQGFTDSLPAIVSRAAKAFLQRELDREEREQAIISDTAINASGQEYSIFETIAGTADTEKSATIRATLKAVYDRLDTTGKVIFKGMAEGRPEREIATAVSLSNAGVHKRAVKIRSQLASLLQG